MRERWFIIWMLWLLCGLPGATAAAAPTSARAPTVLRVAVNQNYPPYFFLDADGKPQGYEAGRWRLFQNHTGIRVQLEPMPWPDVIPALRAGRVDAIDIAYRTPARSREFDFSAPYATVPISIFVDRHIRGITDVAGLRGFRVGVERGDACMHWLESAGITQFQEFPSFETLARAAAGGDPHVFCMANDAASFYLARYDALDRFYEAFRMASPRLQLAVRKDDGALLQTVAWGMGQITPAELARLRTTWLEQPQLAHPYGRWLRILAGLVVALTVLAALAALWIWALRRGVALRTSQLATEAARFRALLEGSPYAMWIRNPSGEELEHNTRADELFRIGAAHGPTGDVGIPDATLAARLQELDAAARQTGRSQVQELDYRPASEAPRRLQVITVPMPGSEGQDVEVLTAALDVTAQRRAEHAQELWGSAFENAGFGVAIFDARSQTIVAVNAAFAHERGYEPGEMTGWSVDRLYPAEIVAERAAVRTGINARTHSIVRTEHVARDGRRFPVLLDCTVNHAADGTARDVIVYASDLTERERHLDELRLAAIAFETQEALLVTDRAGVILRVNAACVRFSGYAADAMAGQPAARLLRPVVENQPGLFRRIARQLQTQGSWRGSIWLRIRGGESRPARILVSRVAAVADKPVGYVVSIVDLTVEHAARASVDHMTFYDPITDLPNRYFLHGRLQHMQEGDGGTVLMIHVDHFKHLNELHGHAMGDRLLSMLARRLTEGLDPRCILGRFSGGTLALLEGCRTDAATAAATCAARVRELLRQPFQLDDGTPVTVTTSIGWTRVIPGRSTPDSAFKEAELAMYSAKAAGRDRVHRFEPPMLARLHYHDTIVRKLREAIAQDTLELHLQAQTDPAGHARGAEALLRWTLPDGERIPPSTFIPIAEGGGLMLELGDWVLARACTYLFAWSQRASTRDLVLAVNVSARQFAEPGFVDHVVGAVVAARADPSRLKLEITESAVLDDLDEVACKLAALRKHRIQVSLDDFGTGYASLSYLSQLPLDEVKIDKSFVARLPDDATNVVVTRAITTMARGLGISVVAEGVETRAQLDFLVREGCDVFQGYLFARPVPPAVFDSALMRRAPVT